MKAALVLFLSMTQQDPARLVDKGQQFAAERNYSEAERAWLKAVSLAPEFFPALFNLGYLNYSQDHFAEAHGWLERASRVNPADFNTQYLLGTVLVKLGKRDDALRQWRTAFQIQPRNVKLMQIMAVEYSKGLYFREAAAVARRALDLQPDNRDLYFVAISAYQNARETAPGLEIAERCARLFPDSARANFEYAFYLQQV